MDRAIETIKKTLQKCREDDSDPSSTHNQKQVWYLHLWVAVEKKVGSTSTFAKRKRKHQNETQETYTQSILRTSTIEFKQHGPLLPG